MADDVCRALSDYALGVGDALDGEVSAEVSRRILDTLGVALGSLREPATVATRRYVDDHGGMGTALVWGTRQRVAPQAAALVNGTAARCLDFNDTYFGRAGGNHPSDVIPGMLAAGEHLRSTGRELAAGIAIAYEVIVCLSDAIAIGPNGWDHVTNTAIGACCGIGRMMGLASDELQQALAITVVPHAAMRQTRRGRLTMWKGIAAANSVRIAMDACMLARAGVQGASDPFEGEAGYVAVLGTGGLDWDVMEPIVTMRPPGRILDTHVKMWPVGYLAQGAVSAAIDVHDRVPDPADIDRITISTFRAAAEIMGGPQMWRPATRETADHSLMYATTAALYDGHVDVDTFDERRLASSGILEILAERVRLVVRDDYTASYPDAHPACVEVTTRSGQEFSCEVRHPRGHARNRCSAEELRAKFDGLTAPVVGARAGEIADAVDELDGCDDVRRFTDLLVL